jgi:hypothetical protein
MADVSLRGSVKGMEVKQAAKLEFPESDKTNPEINRLWASKRISSLLKDADRKGDRSPVIPDIVRLGEDFSIVTEYTSFLVLENDAEYQRWKITRRNLESTTRDRTAQARVREQLDAIRNKAMADIGPQAAAAASKPVQLASANRAVNPPTTAPAAQTPTQPQPQAQPSHGQSFDFRLPGGGSGPVGPLGVLGSLWLMRRKKKNR